ncbi:MAG: type IV secretion system DNA-binding domain-containing protein [Isosphaeraceae bacterium]
MASYPPFLRWLLRFIGEAAPPQQPDVPPGGYRWWGDQSLPADETDPLYYLFLGAIGAGKTSLMKALLLSICPHIRRGSNWRILAYDPKAADSMYAWYCATCPEETEVVNLTPADLRSPHILLPFGGPAANRQIIKSIMPAHKDAGSGQFFERGAQGIGTGVADSIWLSETGVNLADNACLAGVRMTLPLFCQLLRDEYAIVALLARRLETRSKLRLLARPELRLDFLATIEEKLDDILTLAAWWSHSSWEWSVQDFIHGPESIAFMGVVSEYEAAQSIVRRILYKQLTDVILSLPLDPSRRIFLPMDEWHTLGSLDEPQPVPGLERLVTLGRAMGAVLIGALQHPGSLVAACGSKEVAEAILAQFGNVALLKANDETLDTWMCGRMGSYRRWEKKTSYTSGGGSGGSSWSETTSWDIAERTLVPKGTFLGMSKASRKTGIDAYWISGCAGMWHRCIDGSFVDWLPKNHPGVPRYIPRPVSHQILPELKPRDYGLLGIEPPREPLIAREKIENARKEGKRRAANNSRWKSARSSNGSGNGHWAPGGQYHVDVDDLGPLSS